MKVFTKSALRALASIKLKHAVELINPHLYSVEERIREQARAFDPAIEGYVAYACGSSGKRLRPALALLAGGATGTICPSHVDLAVIVELVHLATLVHDDIMDGAEIRREQPTAAAKWGNSLAVLLGDSLFAHALKLATSFANIEICRMIAHTSTEVCSGEMIQTQRRYDLNLSIPDYFRIIEMKTAALFATAGELGAFLNGASPEIILACKTFGLRLGTAYQVYDDCLDLAGSEEKAGKSLGSDLRKGKLTLPVLYLLQTASRQEHHRFSQALLHSETEDVSWLENEVVQRGCLRRSVEKTKELIANAQQEIMKVGVNRFTLAMQEIGDFLANTADQFAPAA